MFFSSDPAVSSSIFVGAEREELIRNDPDKSEFTIVFKLFSSLNIVFKLFKGRMTVQSDF